MSPRNTLAFIVCCALTVPYCATAPKRSPRQRYLQALEYRLDGNSRAYYDELLALAHDAPDTRIGRRARAILQGGELAGLYAAAMLGGLGMSQFGDYQAKARQSEAKETLLQMHGAERAFQASNGTWCPSTDACDFAPFVEKQYVYLVDEKLVAGGDLADNALYLASRARIAASALELEPHLNAQGFLFVAVGDLDEDEDVDVWAVDEKGRVIHVSDDLDTGDEAFGL